MCFDLVAKAAKETGSLVITIGEGGSSMPVTVEARCGFQAIAVIVVGVERRCSIPQAITSEIGSSAQATGWSDDLLVTTEAVRVALRILIGAATSWSPLAWMSVVALGLLLVNAGHAGGFKRWRH